MRALTLTQPWAGLVASGIKLVENRPRRMIKSSDFGCRFAIHASREIDREVWRRIVEIAPELAVDAPGPVAERGRLWPLTEVTSAVIAVATLKGEVFDKTGLLAGDIARELGDQKRWFFGPIGYVLKDVVALSKPVPTRGWQGFWTLPGDVEAKVLGQL